MAETDFVINTETEIIVEIKKIVTLKLIKLANKNAEIAYLLSKFIIIYLTQSYALQNMKNDL